VREEDEEAVRDRREDILPLAHRFLVFFAHSSVRRHVLELTAEAEARILAYAWPGNIRELRNAMERASILARGTQIGHELLPERLAAPPSAPSQTMLGGEYTLEELEREHIARILARTHTVDEAARILGIDTSTLWRKRKRYGEGG
jgi:NtrC-family two-component system response regulator AlgB